MHQMGLAHSDLSYNNILIDPITKSANIIDLDGLVVPGLFPPEVYGTADFIAPEVLKTMHWTLKIKIKTYQIKRLIYTHWLYYIYVFTEKASTKRQ